MSEHHSKEAEARAALFLKAAAAQRYEFYSGVPCSLLGALFAELERGASRDYVSAVREDVAIGLAAGAHLGGKKAMVLMQNSGLGVAYNALASLNEIYEIPVFLLVSWRGEGGKDAPEHLRMGKVMKQVLEELEVPFEVAEPGQLTEQVVRLDGLIQTRRRPAALVVPKGVFA